MRTRIYQWLFTLGLAGYPLVSFLPEMLGLPGRLVTVPFRALVLVLSIIVFFDAIRFRRMYTGMLWVPLGVFWTLYISRILVDTVYYPVADLSLQPVEYPLYAIGVCLLPMIAFFRMPSPSETGKILRVLIIMFGAGCIAAIVYNLDQLSGHSLRMHGNEYLNPIALGHLGASLVIISVWVLLHRNQRDVIPPVFLICAIPLGLLCIALAASRGPLLALCLMLLVALLSTLKRIHQTRLALLLVLCIGAAPLMIRSASEMSSGLVHRLSNTAERVSEGKEKRLVLWIDAWRQFLDRPLIGSALEERNARTYPHNLVIESFMATGLVGGVAFVSIITWSLLAAMRLVFQGGAFAWVGLLTMQQILRAMFSGAIYTRPEMWYLVAATVAILSISRRMGTYESRYVGERASRVRQHVACPGAVGVTV